MLYHINMLINLVHNFPSVPRLIIIVSQILTSYLYILYCHYNNTNVKWFIRLPVCKMAAGQVESDFGALSFDHKTRISDVSECKCCINMKKELKVLQDELSSASLIIKLLQSENNIIERTSYRTIEPRNLIQCTSFIHQYSVIRQVHSLVQNDSST
jgi:hypothetical protein